MLTGAAEVGRASLILAGFDDSSNDAIQSEKTLQNLLLD